jgi:ectoine hydroxylase-related dioxygenase (phytanoyl-CoA dioxygenase family)
MVAGGVVAGKQHRRWTRKRGASSTSSTKESFEKRGYAIVPRVLDAEEVRSLRQVCEGLGDELASGEELAASRLMQERELALVPFKPAITAVMREILGGSFVLFPNVTVRRAVYVPWHVDAAFAGPRPTVWSKDFAHVQCAIYLQDNDPEEGGGLDVVEGSHRLTPSIGDPNGTATWILRRAVNRVRPRRTLPLAAGDLVVWHARTIHRSTRGSRAPRVPKYAVYFAAGRNDPVTVDEYLLHLVGKRHRRVDGRVEYSPRFAEILDLRFPESYPDYVREAAEKADTRVASLRR